MKAEIIKKLNLTRANFCLKEPNQHLTLYHYKKDIFIAESDLSDGVATLNLVYRKSSPNYYYSPLPSDYLLSMPNSEIDRGLNRNNQIADNLIITSPLVNNGPAEIDNR
ncbi:MAG: hypothetical protein Q8891_00350 [Bacteroidota bacterium]|nr:hypothetical protein [Bacteroidota bacterium]